MAVAFDFRDQLLGPWSSAQGALLEGLDRLYAGLAPIQPLLSSLPTTYAALAVLTTDSAGVPTFSTNVGVGGTLTVTGVSSFLTTTRVFGSMQIGGTGVRAGSAGTNRLDIFDGTAPSSILTGGISLYSTAGELRVMDAAGNATLLSPHDHSSHWVFESRNTLTGKRVRIEVEQLLRRLNDLIGEPEWFQEHD